MEIIIIKIFCLYLLFLMVGCQSTTRFSRHNTTEKTSNVTISSNKNKTNIIDKNSNVDTNYYNNSTKAIYQPKIINTHNANIIRIAEKWLGTPYLYGGNTKAGVDCSGFVRNVYLEIGIDLPRTSAQQFEFLIPTKVPVVGDLVFFKKGNIINHVGIFIGDGKIIHSSSKKGVIIESILGTSLEHRLAGYRKVSRPSF